MDIALAGLRFTTDSPEAWSLTDSGFDGPSLTGVAGPRTDLFIDPATGETTGNAPRLLATPPSGDWQLRARVAVEFGETFDAGALVVWSAPDRWIKLACEQSPQGAGMVVTVVTRGRSDDANGSIVDGGTVWLRLSHVNGAYACHASADGVVWDFVRHLDLAADTADEVRVGFEAQSPLGQGCTATFTDIGFTAATLADLRDGS